jgi:hypothetical protein
MKDLDAIRSALDTLEMKDGVLLEPRAPGGLDADARGARLRFSTVLKGYTDQYVQFRQEISDNCLTETLCIRVTFESLKAAYLITAPVLTSELQAFPCFHEHGGAAGDSVLAVHLTNVVASVTEQTSRKEKPSGCVLFRREPKPAEVSYSFGRLSAVTIPFAVSMNDSALSDVQAAFQAWVQSSQSTGPAPTSSKCTDRVAPPPAELGPPQNATPTLLEEQE